MEHVIDQYSNATMSHSYNQLTWPHYISKAIENSVPGVKSSSKVFRYENG